MLESINRVTPSQFRAQIKRAQDGLKEINILLIEEDESGYLVTTFTVDPIGKTITEVTEDIDDIEDFLEKNKNPIHFLLDEVPKFLTTFRDDSEYIVDFQKVCKIISDKHRDEETDKLLSELVDFYRQSERSGYSLGEMVMDEINQQDYNQDELESE